MPSLSFEMLRVARGTRHDPGQDRQGRHQERRPPGLEIPTDKNGQLWVHFARQDPSIYVSAADVLDGTVRAGQDRRQAGADRHLRGRLERHQDHAGVLDDAGRRDSCPGAGERADRRGAVAAELWHRCRIARRARARACWSSSSRRSSDRSRWSLSARCSPSLLVGTSWYFYTQHRLLIDFTYPLLSTTAIYLTLIFASFVREQPQRKQIRSAFGQYMSPALVEQLAQSPESWCSAARSAR